jgi:hypothetical protein
MADEELQGTQAEQTPAPADAGVPDGTPEPQAATTQTAAPEPAQGYVPLHEALRQAGYELPEGTEGYAALTRVVQDAKRARELAHLEPYGRQYVQHADKFQAYLKAQDEAARKAQTPEPAKWWNPPQYDPAWQSKIVRDQQGNLQVLPGHDPAILNKFLAWREHQQDFIERFTSDPIGAIRPGIEEVVQQVAERLVQDRLAQTQAQQFTTDFLRQNEWLYEAGDRSRLSPEGRAFTHYLAEAEKLGLPDDQARSRYALSMTQAHVAVARSQQQAPPDQQNARAKQDFLDRGQQAAQRPATPAQATASQAAQTPVGGSLEQRLRMAAKAAGVTDDQVNSTLTRVR